MYNSLSKVNLKILKMSNLKLTIDARERAVIPFFKEENPNIDLEVKQIQIGDYAISHGDNILFCIERKSWRDLSGSIKDGRIENVNKLISLREKTNCKLFYLIEGRARNAPNKRFARIPYKSLLSHLDHLMFRDNIHIIYSNDEEDTAVRLIELCNSYLTLNIKPTIGAGGVSLEGVEGVSASSVENPGGVDGQSIDGASTNIALLTTVIPKTDLQIIYNLWCAIPQITTKTATLFIDANYHISDLILGKITKETISTIRYPNGTIIGKRADKIIKIKDSDDPANYKHYCNIIAEIPGVTKKTAMIILMKATFDELITGHLSINELSLIKKTEKSKIGDSVAKKIYKFLVKN